MNKPAERKEGGKGEEKGRERGGGHRVRGGTKLDLFTPLVSLYPENVIGLTRGVVVGSLA